MQTWQQFFEAKEKSIESKEEELHKDLDNDNEEGESEEHKKKVLGCCEVCGKKKCTCRPCKSCCKSKKQCKC